MLLKLGVLVRRARWQQTFSTLYRVDAIEARRSSTWPEPWGSLSVPSIGSMLLKLIIQTESVRASRSFSTLYRVDAIEASGRRRCKSC